MLGNFSIMWAKFRVWGLPGVWSYFSRRYFWWKMERRLKRLAAMDADAVPERGITLIGDFKEGASNSKTNRDFAHALKDAGIPFQTYSVDRRCTIPREDYEDILTPESEFRLHRYTHVIEMFRSPLPRGLVKNRARIAFWEGEHGMFDVWPFLRGKDPIIGMSDFNVEYFRRNPDGAPVYKILYPLRKIDVKLPSVFEVRSRFGIAENAFVVFFNFDFGSYKRKNPLAAIKAFARAFRENPNCRLIFKVQGTKNHTTELAEVWSAAEAEGIRGQMQVITDYLSHGLLYGLTSACDVYLSLHHGEGFGIGMAEAMLFGKPVVATDWSANTEFCQKGCSIPIPYRLIPVKQGEYFEAMKVWADPDVDAAADALRELYANPGLRESLGRNAKTFIREHFSVSRFKQSVEAFLDD